MAKLPAGLKIKQVKTEGNNFNWFLEIGEEYKRNVALDMLKEHRSRLKAAIPNIKHTVRQKQAIKKERRIDYVIGRMVFFNEDLSTAGRRMQEEVKKGEL